MKTLKKLSSSGYSYSHSWITQS